MPIKPKNVVRPWERLPTGKAKGQKPGRYKAAQRFYNSVAWKKLRDLVLIEHPLCECDDCKKNNRSLPANVVDHIKPINHNDPYDTKQGKYGEPLNRANLMAMNNSCHNRKTAKENAYIYKRGK